MRAAQYTLEESKQQAERDAMMAAAEAKKKGVRGQLDDIRREVGIRFAPLVCRAQRGATCSRSRARP